MQNIPYFDAHCDTLSRLQETGEGLRKNGGHLDLERLGAYDPAGQIFALFASEKDCSPAERFDAVCKQAEIFLRAKEEQPERMKHCFLSLEGAESVGCDEAMLPKLKDWGVRWVNLTWNYANALSGSCKTGEGLSRKGRSFVRSLYRLGMYVDVSHLSDRGFWDLCDLAEGPILASHSNARALHHHGRNLSDEMAKEIFASGGIVGINFYTEFLGMGEDLDAVAAHIEHFLALGGEERVVMGSDFDGADMPAMLGGAEQMPNLWEHLYRRNYSRQLIEKLAWGNLADFLELNT